MRARQYSSLRAWVSAWSTKGARAAERFKARRAQRERKFCALAPEGVRGLDAERDVLGVGDLVLGLVHLHLLEQQVALMRAEGIALAFEKDAVAEIARLAAEINRAVENIGARRLHTVIEKVMEDIS
jgi:hypothetical protein